MSLSSNIVNTDEIELSKINRKYLMLLFIFILLIIGLLIINKECYYENNLLVNDNSLSLIVEKGMINKIKDKKTILINSIISDYSINRIIDDGSICYVNIKLYPDMENISNTKYKILLGKETIFEYIIRIIKKMS